MKKPLWVYISGTMTNGDGQSFNMGAIAVATRVFLYLINKGCVPICPHLSVFCQFLDANLVPYEKWLALDKGYIDKCDLVLRLPGPSKGADIECAYAREVGVTVIEADHNDIDVHMTLEQMCKNITEAIQAPRMTEFVKGSFK